MKSLYARYRTEVYSWLLRTTGDKNEAEDLYHDAWLKIIEGASKFDGGNFRAWLWRITRNLAINRARKMKPVLTLDAPLEDGTPMVETVGGGMQTAPGALQAKEEFALIRKAIASLPVREREVVLLRVESSLKFKEIAKLLGKPLNTVLAHMHRAVEKLKSMPGMGPAE